MNLNNPNLNNTSKFSNNNNSNNDNNDNKSNNNKSNDNKSNDNKDMLLIKNSKVEKKNQQFTNEVNKNRINYIQLTNGKGRKNKKKKNKRYLHELINEEYDNYIEANDNNEYAKNEKSYKNLMSLNKPNLEYVKIEQPYKSSNFICKSKSLTNFDKVKEMKETIRKNASYNLVSDIVFELSQNNEIKNTSSGIKKNISGSFIKTSKKSLSPTKYMPNDSNKFSYLIGDDCVDLESDECDNSNKNSLTHNEFKKSKPTTNIQHVEKKNKKSKQSKQINFDEIKDLDDKINSVADYHLIHTPFKMIGEEILNEEINSKYKPKVKANPENEPIIRKLRDTFKKLVYKEVKDKPNISQILLDTSLDDDLKVKILRKYIKFTTEDEVFTDEADKIKIEIKNLLKQKKLRVSDDFEELGKLVEAKVIPDNLKTKLEDIYYRVIGGDQQKLHNMLNNLLKLPFEPKPNILNQMSKSNIQKEEKVKFIKELYAKLDADLYGMEETKDSIISWICQKISNPDKKTSKYLCLCGSAGVGKTSIVHSISECLKIPYSYISLANIDEPSSLIGHGYTYEGSQCGSVANGLILNGCTNGILLFDELDKTKEKVQNTLLGIFDPLQNTKFRDAYFGEFNLNLSECMMIVCLNDISNVNPILKDRLHIVNIPGYTTKDKKIIVSKYIIPKLNSQYKLEKVEIEDEVIDEIIQETKNYSGIRQIQMYITKIYELLTLDEYINKYNFNGVFGIKNISLLKFGEKNISYLSLYT